MYRRYTSVVLGSNPRGRTKFEFTTYWSLVDLEIKERALDYNFGNTLVVRVQVDGHLEKSRH